MSLFPSKQLRLYSSSTKIIHDLNTSIDTIQNKLLYAQIYSVQHYHLNVPAPVQITHIMFGNRAQYSNTRLKLLEVIYGRTSHHNKGLLTMNSPVISQSAHYGVRHKEYARHGGL